MNYNLSIRNKIFLSSVFGLLLFAILVIYYYPKHQRHLFYDAVEIKDHFMAETIAINVALGIESGKFNLVSRSLQTAKKDENLLYIGIFDEKRNMLSELNFYGEEIDYEMLWQQSEFCTYHKIPIHIAYEPIRGSEKSYGTLLYVSDLSLAHSTIDHNKFEIIRYGSITLILGLIIAFITSYRITQPITDLIKASQRIAQGERNVQIENKYTGEIEVLNNSFNEMSQSIDDMLNSIKASEERYHHLTEASPIGIFHTDNRGGCTYVNERWARITGIPADEIIGKNLAMFVKKEDRKILLKNWKYALHKMATSNSEVRIVSKAQKQKWVNIQLTGEYDQANHLKGLVGTLEDITVRKRAEGINRALLEILEAMSTTGNLEDYLEEIHRILASLIDTTNFYVALYHPELDKYTFPFYKDEFDAVSDLPVNLKKSQTDYVRRTGQSQFIDKATFEKLIRQKEIESIGEPSSLWLGVPLKTQNGIIGVAVVQSYSDSKLYTVADLDILTIASGHIAMAIERKKADDELKKSEELLRATLDSTVDGIVVSSSEGRILTANDNYFKIWRLPDELRNEKEVGKALAYVADELEDPEYGMQEVMQLMNSTEENNDQIHFKDGRVFDQYSCPLIRDGEVYGRVWSFRDITKAKADEAKLAELAAFPEANTEIVISISEELEILYMNTATKTILSELGMKEEELNSLLPKNIKNIIEDISDGYEGRNNIEVSYQDRSFLWSFFPVLGQKIVHAYASDITEELKRKDEMIKLSTVVNQSSAMVCILSRDLIVEYVNPSFTKVTGYSIEEIVGHSVREFDSDKHPTIFFDAIWEKVQKGMTWSGNIQMPAKNGDWYWQRTTVTPIFSENREIINFFINGFDVTRELQTQQKLIESDKLSAVGTLAAGVAHEFKNYLGGIIGNASFCLEELDDDDGLDKARSTLSDIIDMSEKANEVAMSLLTYSKAKMEDRKEEDLKAVINKSIKLVESEFKNLDIEIITHFEDVPPVEISISKIQQVMLNLLINASHAIKSYGVVSIYLKNLKDKVEIRVADSGSGISKANLTKIFDPFFSTKGVWGKDEVVGTGMGLSICRNIIEEHGGQLTVDSIEGIGTTFYLNLPLPGHKINLLPSNSYEETKGLVFSFDRSVVTAMYEQACRFNSTLTLLDNVYLIQGKLKDLTDFVICDARFTAKLELLKMVEMCRQEKVPYVMIKCGSMEYQLEEIYENSLVNFKEVPDFQKIYEIINNKSEITA